jgi:hypothetical protein
MTAPNAPYGNRRLKTDWEAQSGKEAIASMTNEERRAMLKAALQKYKAKQLAAQREKDAGIPPTKEPT